MLQKIITLRLDPDQHAALRALAKERGLPLTVLFRRLAEAELKRVATRRAAKAVSSEG